MIEKYRLMNDYAIQIDQQMTSREEFETQLQGVISRVHQFLSNNFTLVPQTRDLNSKENQLLLDLEPNSIKYKQLAATLAIESYSEYVVNLISGCEPILEITALVFGTLSEARSWALQTGASDLQDILEETWLNLGKLAEITHKLFPKSPMVTIHRSFIEQAGSDPSDTIYGRLYEENLDLKNKLQQNDKTLLDLELKLTKLLQQHDGCQGNVDSSMRIIELREQLALKNDEIQKMNQEFAVEIEKYNTVYQAMKREIEDLKDFKDADLVDMVEKLETEIVKLREERERDEMIIRELKERGQYVSPKRNVTSYSRVYY